MYDCKKTLYNYGLFLKHFTIIITTSAGKHTSYYMLLVCTAATKGIN